nr:hypothetical protein [Providencia sp. PROV257]
MMDKNKNNKDLVDYEHLHNLVMSMVKNKKYISQKDSFSKLQAKNKDEIPEIPYLKYEKNKRVPKGTAEMLLRFISSMLKMNMELPPNIRRYLYEAIDNQLKKGDEFQSLQDSFFLNVVYRKQGNKKETINDYIYHYLLTRVSTMYTLGYPREKLKKYKNSKKGTLYDELSDELCFKFKLDGDIYRRESYIIDGVSVHPDNLKELFIKENINSTIKFDNDNLLNDNHKAKLNDYVKYLNSIIISRKDLWPFNADDAIKRLKALNDCQTLIGARTVYWKYKLKPFTVTFPLKEIKGGLWEAFRGRINFVIYFLWYDPARQEWV